MDPLINLGNDGQWHWIELKGLSARLIRNFWKWRTAEIDSSNLPFHVQRQPEGRSVALERRVHSRDFRPNGESLTDGTFPKFPLGGADLCEEDKIYLGVKSGKQISSASSCGESE